MDIKDLNDYICNDEIWDYVLPCLLFAYGGTIIFGILWSVIHPIVKHFRKRKGVKRD